MTDEPRYTLAEAQRLLKQGQCEMTGHSFHVERTYFSPDPAYVICTRCGRMWSVVSTSEPRI